ncbi:hypothetical protein D9M72_589630 [compost metagenome]
MLLPSAAWAVIQSRMDCSQGQRSSSCSGVPAFILAMLESGWNWSASAMSQPRSRERAPAMVDLPAPATPMTTKCMAGNFIVLPP